jgi:hypothetical protein
VPEKPGRQVQEKELNPSEHEAPFRQGLEVHSLILVWQSGPEKPIKQEQEKEFKESAQVAPF